MKSLCFYFFAKGLCSMFCKDKVLKGSHLLPVFAPWSALLGSEILWMEGLYFAMDMKRVEDLEEMEEI